MIRKTVFKLAKYSMIFKTNLKFKIKISKKFWINRKINYHYKKKINKKNLLKKIYK